MNKFYFILSQVLLSAVLAFMINLFSNWAWEKLFNKPLNKFIGFLILIAIFAVIIFCSYAQWPSDNLPSGIDKESGNIQSAWNNKGVALFKQGQYADAIECYDNAIEINPEYTLAWVNKGNALKMMHREYEADKAFEKARGEA